MRRVMNLDRVQTSKTMNHRVFHSSRDVDTRVDWNPMMFEEKCMHSGQAFFDLDRMSIDQQVPHRLIGGRSKSHMMAGGFEGRGGLLLGDVTRQPLKPAI